MDVNSERLEVSMHQGFQAVGTKHLYPGTQHETSILQWVHLRNRF